MIPSTLADFRALVRCSMVQCGAVCCSVLQCGAVCCRCYHDVIGFFKFQSTGALQCVEM